MHNLLPREAVQKTACGEYAYAYRGGRLLDLGCATGEFLEVVQKRYPDIDAYGVDPDSALLEIARQNLQKEGLAATLVEAYAERLPFPDAYFDAIFCTLTLHHVPPELKQQAIREMYRVLKSSGTILLADFGKKRIPMLGIGQMIFEEKAYLKDHFAGKIPDYLTNNGFEILDEKRYQSISIWVAKKA